MRALFRGRWSGGSGMVSCWMVAASARDEFGRYGLSSRFSRRSFQRGRTPTHPFVDSRSLTSGRSGDLRLTHNILCDRLADESRLNQLNAQHDVESTCHLRLTIRREGSHFLGKWSRCNRHFIARINAPFPSPVFVSNIGSASPFRLRRRIGLRPDAGVDAAAMAKGAVPFVEPEPRSD